VHGELFDLTLRKNDIASAVSNDEWIQRLAKKSPRSTPSDSAAVLDNKKALQHLRLGCIYMTAPVSWFTGFLQLHRSLQLV
jgi:hypothetical protein